MPTEAKQFGHVVGFNEVFTKEVAVISERRQSQNLQPIRLRRQGTDSSGVPVLVPEEGSGMVGIALSGGGIRSAAFCLGVLQALDETNVLKRIDYLSTVSGGGYIGCSLSACLELGKGEFPFKTTRFEDETPSVQHIRDYSNYLLPNRALDAVHNTAIYVRGLLANLILVMPFLLVAAGLTILIVGAKIDFDHFVLTGYLGLFLLVVIVLWGLHRSRASAQGEPEVPGTWTTVVGAVAFVVFLVGFCELQPFVLAATSSKSGPFSTISKLVTTVSLWLAPVAAIIATLARQFGDFIKSSSESPRAKAQIAGYAAKLAIYLASLVVPLLLWAAFLNLARLGICLNQELPGCAVPTWLKAVADRVGNSNRNIYVLVFLVYFSIAAILFVLTLFLRPNANSLHALYRDRLAKAFLFEPENRVHRSEELKPLKKRLSEISGRFGPYHIINTSLNIQNSTVANKRGRNADFFSFSRDFVGSEATGYVATADIEKVTKGLDLASVMAISGAAASSNMGAQTIKPLTPTLALLNIRLGYWLRNPAHLKSWKTWNRLANYYFLAELLGRLNENRKSVYLTDGSHIENLGIYELLKRRCSVIIAVDAEADFELAFGSFNTLVRYARIDLSIEIDLPWEQIRDVHRSINDKIDNTGNCPKLEGPHCAIGRITYAGGATGILVYIKSSLTGDENDYVFHYKKRHPRFPHESTLEQMFSEEQFEAYRALGYHAAYGLFDRRDTVAQLDLAEYPDYRKQVGLIDKLFPRVTIGGPPTRHQHLTDWLPPGPPP
jgi:hypothetical protein